MTGGWCSAVNPVINWRKLADSLHLMLSAGESRRQSLIGQTTAASHSWWRRFTDGHRQLLQGRAPRPRHHPRGPASPEAAGEHLATPKGPSAPAPAAVCVSAGRPTGKHNPSTTSHTYLLTCGQ